jgi:hypothetical protein
VLNGQNYKMFKKKTIEIIVENFKLNINNEKSMKALIGEIVKIAQNITSDEDLLENLDNTTPKDN